jgi:hypothetical protein
VQALVASCAGDGSGSQVFEAALEARQTTQALLQLVAPSEDALMTQGSVLTSVQQRHCLIDDGL